MKNLLKYTVVYIVLLGFATSCDVVSDNESFTFLRPDENLVQEKLNNGSIKKVNAVFIDTSRKEKIMFFFNSFGQLDFDRWCFKLQEFSLNAVNKVLENHSDDLIGYILLFNECDTVDLDRNARFSFRNIHNNKIFFGTIFSSEDDGYELCIDYYYPDTKVSLPESLKLASNRTNSR